MDEQLEQPIEGGTGEVLPEAAVSPAGEEAVKEAAEGTGNPEAEVNTESSAEENNSDAELSGQRCRCLQVRQAVGDFFRRDGT